MGAKMRDSVQKQIDACYEKGMRTEDRFFEAINDTTAKDLPPWILRARRPTSTQDKFEGVDAIVETSDVGQLYVQIKSSKKYAEKFKNGRHYAQNKSIIVIVIGASDTPADIRAKVRGPLSKLRREYFTHMCNICNK